MNFKLENILYLFVFIIECGASAKSNVKKTDTKGCTFIDGMCLNSWDVASYEAIRLLHAHLDDDHNGDIDLHESVDFLREELNYTNGIENRQEAFHFNNDQHISLMELWNLWLNNEVHNWTIDQTVSWLSFSVDLQQYADVFYQNSLNGTVLPRLAANSDNIFRTLGIKNPAHKSKISIKAMDVVLFGPPKDSGSLLKDVIILFLFTFLLVGTLRFYQVKKRFEQQRSCMIQEIEALHAEEQNFREELELLRPVKAPDKELTNEVFTESLNGEESAQEKWTLDSPETEAESPLQLWLQLTYERERISFEAKCQLVEAQLSEAKEMCEKLHPSKKQFFVALGLVHGKTEPKYNAITDAVRESITDIKNMHKEMEHRWTTIEKWTNNEIINNKGVNYLEFLLEPDLHSIKSPSSSSIVHSLLRSQSALIFLTLGGYSGLGLNAFQRKRKKHKNSPEGSIKSVTSAQSKDSFHTASMHHSNTIASGMESRIVESIEKNESTTEDKNESEDVCETSTSNCVNTEDKKIVENGGGGTQKKGDNKCNSEPSLEIDDDKSEIITDHSVRRSLRKSKFLRSKIFDKFKSQKKKESSSIK